MIKYFLNLFAEHRALKHRVIALEKKLNKRKQPKAKEVLVPYALIDSKDYSDTSLTISFDEIKERASHGDYQLVTEAVSCSYSLVRAVVDRKRSDRKNIQLAFNILFKQREDFNKQIKSLDSQAKLNHKTVAA